MHIRALRLGFLITTLIAVFPVAAQEGPVTFEFSFSNPGARSMGLAGAFTALADDATAAFANPAGLTQLLEPEVSAEGRWWSYEAPYVESGRFSGEATGEGIDTVDGLNWGSSEREVTGLSFVSFVFPGDRWSLAVYWHRWADFDFDRRINGLFGIVDGELDRSEDVLERTELSVANSGLSGAWEISDKLSLGLGLVYYQAELDSFSEEYVVDDDAFFEPNGYDQEQLDTSYTRCGKDSGFNVQLGFLWRPTNQWSIGGHYRQGPELTLSVREITGPAEEDDPPGTVHRDDTAPLSLPDVFGLGVAYRSAGGALTVSFQWDRVRYSMMGDDLDGGVFDEGEVTLGDGDELRLGIEYVFVDLKPLVAVRLGAWHDPAHGIVASWDADPIERAIFHGGEDQLHVSAGLGLVFDRFQLDLGVDLADTVDTASLSIVYRF